MHALLFLFIPYFFAIKTIEDSFYFVLDIIPDEIQAMVIAFINHSRLLIIAMNGQSIDYHFGVNL